MNKIFQIISNYVIDKKAKKKYSQFLNVENLIQILLFLTVYKKSISNKIFLFSLHFFILHKFIVIYFYIKKDELILGKNW